METRFRKPVAISQEFVELRARLREQRRNIAIRHAGGSPKIIGCMKELWSYLMNSFEDPQNIWRKVKKINNLDIYEETVELIFRDEKLKVNV